MAGETADIKTSMSQLVECENGPKFKNKGITWLSTAQDGALRKTVHFGSGRKVADNWRKTRLPTLEAALICKLCCLSDLI